MRLTLFVVVLITFGRVLTVSEGCGLVVFGDLVGHLHFVELEVELGDISLWDAHAMLPLVLRYLGHRLLIIIL